MKNIKSNQVMSSGWNRKESYMLEKDNMTRHIKFMSYWIKTTIPPFTFTITQNTQIVDRDDNFLYFSCGQRMKQVQPKTLKEE
jgi:hypothetical protein